MGWFYFGFVSRCAMSILCDHQWQRSSDLLQTLNAPPVPPLPRPKATVSVLLPHWFTVKHYSSKVLYMHYASLFDFIFSRSGVVAVVLCPRMYSLEKPAHLPVVLVERCFVVLARRQAAAWLAGLQPMSVHSLLL